MDIGYLPARRGKNRGSDTATRTEGSVGVPSRSRPFPLDRPRTTLLRAGAEPLDPGPSRNLYNYGHAIENDWREVSTLILARRLASG